MAKVPKKFHHVFWEVDAKKLDTEENPEFIMERILEYGTLESVTWLRKTLGDEELKQYIKSQTARRRLSTKTLNFWQVILKLKAEECMSISSMKNRSPFWNY